MYLKANVCLDFDAPLEEKLAYWERNISVVENFMRKWGQGGPGL